MKPRRQPRHARPLRRRPTREANGLATCAIRLDLAGKVVYVIDANSLIFQVFHAIPEMTSPQGEPVNAVYGFTRDLLFLLEKKRPDYLFSAHDPPGPTFRHLLYEPYKAQRGEMPEELRPQFPKIQQVLVALGIPGISVPSFEADDLLATVARETEALGGDCIVVTGDKDCRQLITDHVQVYNVRKDSLYDAAALQAEWGVRPDQVVDFQALVGDSVDNVPGVAQIGPKAARELLEKYDTLDGILEHAAEVSGQRRRENLLAGREQALLSRKLVRLDAHVPIELDWQQAEVRPRDPTADAGLVPGVRLSSLRRSIARRPQAVGRSAASWQPTIARSTRPRSLRTFLPGCRSKPCSRSTWRRRASRRRRLILSATRSVGPRARPTICLCGHRKAKRGSTNTRRWLPCGRFWKTRRSARLART